MRSELGSGLLTEHLLSKAVKNALQIGHCDALINYKSLNLVEHG